VRPKLSRVQLRFPLRGRRPTPRTLIGSINSEFKKLRAGIDQLGDSLAGGETAFLCCDSTAFAPPPWRIVLLHSDFGEQIHDAAVFSANPGDFEFTMVSAPKRTREDLTR